jgi:hypothetical protein
MGHLPARMQATSLHHAVVVRELTMLQATVSSATELVLGRLLGEASRVEVMNELIAKFQELEELCSRRQGPSARFSNLLLGP